MKKIAVFAATFFAALTMVSCEDPEIKDPQDPGKEDVTPTPDPDKPTPEPDSEATPTGSFDYTKLDAVAHPRVLISAEAMTALQSGALASNPAAKIFNTSIIERCDEILTEGDLANDLVNKRLTTVAEKALERIFFLSYGYRTTQKAEYLTQAEKDINAVCGWTDWNGENYVIDAAELTAAVALGYDWLYDNLSEATRTAALAALKAHAPALVTEAENSTNAICNAAAGLAALAMYDNGSKATAAKLLDDAVAANKKGGFVPYGHAGAYVEGYDIWAHATTYEAMLISALEAVFANDGGLYATSESFVKSAEWALFMVGTSGNVFNYGNAQEKAEPKLANWFFARKENDTKYLHVEKKLYNDGVSYKGRFSEYRLLPAIFALMDPAQATKIPAAPTSHYWYCDNNGEAADGMAFVAVFSTGEGVDSYYAVKGGSANGYNGHQDNGSFVYDFKGVRLVTDLGAGNEAAYAEAAGADYHNYSTGSARWTSAWAYSNLAHNVPNFYEVGATTKPIAATDGMTTLNTEWADSPWGANGKNYTRWNMGGVNSDNAAPYVSRIDDATRPLERDFQFSAAGQLSIWEKFDVLKDCTYRWQCVVPKEIVVQAMGITNVKLTMPDGTSRRLKLTTKNCYLNGEQMKVNTNDNPKMVAFVEPLTGEFEGYHVIGFEGNFVQGDEVKLHVSFPEK